MSLSRGGWLPAAKPRSGPQALLPSWVLVFLGGGEGARPGWKCESAAARADGAAASLTLLEARQRGG